MVSSLGVGSGLPLSNLVTQLVSLEGAPKTQDIALQQNDISIETKALQKLQSTLSGFQGVVQGNVLNASNFTAKSGSSSDSSVVTVTPSSSAANGIHSITVTNLAQAQTITSDSVTPFAETSTTIGTGTLTFTFGTYSGGVFTANTTSTPQTVTINSGNNTLSGISSAINAANIGVNASVINNGSGYLLVLTSAETGASNSMKITVSNDGDANDTDDAGLSQFAYDPEAAIGSGKNLTQTVEPLDASIQFDGLTITNSSNTLTELISGATVNLLDADATAKTITISNNTSTATSNIQAFVNSFNNVYNSTIQSLASYDAEKEEAGPLFADSAVSTLDQQLRSYLGGMIPELRGRYQSLADIGITFKTDGSLKLDTSMLNAALADDPNAVAKVFSAGGSTTNSSVQYNGSSSSTVAGSYVVNITQAATQGTLAGSAAANTTITTGVNDLINVTLDNHSATVTLVAGVYTADSLAAMVQTQINNNAIFNSAGVSLTVSQAGGVLSLTSAAYGSTSGVNITGGNGATDLVGGAAVATAGLDVAGTIGGEVATGAGRLLTGHGTKTQDLSLTVTATTTGDFGVVDFTQGVASRLNTALTDMLDSDGYITTRLQNLSNRDKALKKEQTALNLQLAAYQKMLVAKFSALDTFVSSQKSTLAFLQSVLISPSNFDSSSSSS